MKKGGFYILFSLILLGVSSCEKERVKEVTTRTVLVYLGRDNNLADLSEEKIESLVQGWDGEGGNLVVYQDLYGQKPRLMEIVYAKGNTRTEIIHEYEPENSADKEVFAGVLHETIRLYPADSYGLILFSHASGWMPKATLNAPRSVVIDGRDEMEITDLASAIPDQLFDFIVFEACYMAGIEVAFELKDKTKYILASSAEMLSPGLKQTYASSLALLFKQEPDLASFAQQAFDYYNNQTTDYKRSATFSLIHTAALNQLASFIAQTNQEVNNPVDLAQLQYFDRYYPNHLFYDFEDYYAQLYASSPLHLQELNRLLTRAVVEQHATPTFLLSYKGFTINKHSGLTLYIPNESYPYLNEQYKKLAWYKQTHLD